uniref:Uncharacterized protein n=1 Tax=Clytia hemisphaerica TaxID=252671 RepID=A0A7M5XH00_9CNID
MAEGISCYLCQNRSTNSWDRNFFTANLQEVMNRHGTYKINAPKSSFVCQSCKKSLTKIKASFVALDNLVQRVNPEHKTLIGNNGDSQSKDQQPKQMQQVEVRSISCQ